MMHKFAYLFFSFFLLTSLAAADDAVRIIQKSGDKIRLEITATLPVIKEATVQGQLASEVQAADWPIVALPQGVSLPYKPILLHLQGKNAALEILSATENHLSIQPPYSVPDEAIAPDSLHLTLPPNLVLRSQHSGVAPEKIASLRYLGRFSGNHLWSLDVFPYCYDFQSGRLIIHGKIEVEVTAAMGQEQGSASVPVPTDEASFIKGIGAIAAAKSKSVEKASMALSKPVAQSEQKYKILVNADGLYHITGDDLHAAGVSLFDVDIKTLKLTADGFDVPIYVHGWKDGQFDDDDYFEFWGQYHRRGIQQIAPDLYQDIYSKTNAYWLSWGASRGQWMIEEQGLVTDSPAGQPIRPYSFYETVHVERDAYYDRLSQAPADYLRDFWFYDTGISSAKKRDYAFDLWHPDDLSPLDVQVRIMMCGRTVSDTVSHQADAFLNNSFIGSGSWWRQGILDLHSDEKNTITGSDLINGRNALTIVNTVAAQSNDYIMLNWFEVTYPRLYRAHKDFIKFTIPPNYNPGSFLFKVDGFESEQIEVYKLGSSKIVGGLTEEVTDLDQFTSWQLAFQDYVSSSATEYVALSPNAKLKPLKIEPATPAYLKTDQLAADYIIIAHKRFVDSPSLEKLISLRQAQGYRVLKVDVQNVYDEFNFGRANPQAIKDFLGWAYHHYQSPEPKYVLLVGDGCYERFTSAGDTLDLIPVYMRQTESFGAAASDHWYTLVDGDDEVPDLHIGRLPVRDEEALSIFINKITNYEEEPPKGDWRNRVLVIGGDGAIFRTQGIALVQDFPPQFEPQMLYTVKDNSKEYDPYFGGTADLLDHFDEGCAVMTFHGHGGGAIWADKGLLRLEDVERIYTRGKFPLILSMTCFTGAFESPSSQNLADALLTAKDEGTMAYFGCSGVGWTRNDYLLLSEIMQYFYQHPDRPIGEILDAGKISYWTKYQFYEVQAFSQLNQYHLLGDPATRLAAPSQIVPVAIDNTLPQVGDTLHVSATVPFERGVGRFDLADSTNLTVTGWEVTVVSGVASADIIITDNLLTRSGCVRFYASNDLGTSQVHGAAAFSLRDVLFDSATVLRKNVDSLYFKVRVASRQHLSGTRCLVGRDSLDMSELGNGWYFSQKGLVAPAYSNSLSYSFLAITDSGEKLSSRTFTYELPRPLDFTIKNQSIRLAGSDHVMLQAEINNTGGIAAEDVPVLFERFTQSSGQWQLIGQSTIAIAAASSAIAEVPFSSEPDTVQIRVTIDPDSLFREDARYNNKLAAILKVSAFNCSPDNGIEIQGAPADTLHYSRDLKVLISPQVVPTNTVLAITQEPSPNKYEQPDFVMPANAVAYEVSLPGSGNILAGHISISLLSDEKFRRQADSTGKTLSIYRFVTSTRKWLRSPSIRQGAWLSTETTELGTFAVLAVDDSQSPRIEISIDGQPYVANTFISPEPQFGILVQDINGVDLSAASLNIALDGKALSLEDLALPDSINNANQVMLSTKPTLIPGQHNLSISAADCNGNFASPVDLVFMVAKELEVTVLGNYPNPFEEETTFAYLLSLPIDKLSLKIYTASGRLIRNLNPNRDAIGDPNPLGADYHELVWDGTDDDGNDVANGVYFYKLEASGSGKTKETTGKVARIQ
jgi:hypothetical protein